jgi:hypothetical protein
MDLPSGRPYITVDHVQQSGLAGAVQSDDCPVLTPVKVPADIPEDVLLTVYPGDIFHMDDPGLLHQLMPLHL